MKQQWLAEQDRSRILEEQLRDMMSAKEDVEKTLRTTQSKLDDQRTTEQANIDEAHITRGYRWWTAGGARLSLADRGLTFGTNASGGVCVHFREPVSSPRAQEAVTRFAEATAALSGSRATAEYRDRLASAFLHAEEFMSEEEGPYSASEPRYGDTHGRYLSLVAVINATTPEEDDPVPYLSWVAAALRASVSQV